MAIRIIERQFQMIQFSECYYPAGIYRPMQFVAGQDSLEEFCELLG